METKDKWSIKIGGGYGKNKTRIRPAEALVELLNFKYTSDKELATFCESRKLYLFPRQGKILSEMFEEERSLLKLTASRLLNKDFSEAVLDVVNEHLSYSKTQISLASTSSLESLNYSSDELKGGDAQYLIRTKVYSDTFAPFWEELVKRIVDEQNLKVCQNCGDFYITSQKSSRKWCKPACGVSYRQKKFRTKTSSK